MRTTEDLKLMFECAMTKAKNLYYTTSGHGSSRDCYISGLYSLYMNMFGSYPYEFEISQFVSVHSISYEEFTNDDYRFAKKYLYKYSKYVDVDYIATLVNIKNANKDNSYLISMSGIHMIILDEYIVYWTDESSFSVLCPQYMSIEDNIKIKCKEIHFTNILFTGDVWNGWFKINDYIAYKNLKRQKETPFYYYIIRTANGFDTTNMHIKDYVNIDIDQNYNDDLPYDKIVSFLTSKDESGLVILRGVPGSGKTYLIRHFITNIKKDFIIINESCLDYMNDPSFLKILMDHPDSIIILEDCEKVLTERNNGNYLIGTLLNLSDGIISDTFNMKFICTFNAELTDIDEALLRKGRLKVKYEFGKLSKEKTQRLAEKLGKNITPGVELTLADIYNYDDEVDFATKKKKIGF